MAPEVATLGPGDRDRAEQIRAELRPLLEQVAQIITMAQREGLRVGFQIQGNQFGQQIVQPIDIVRPL